MPILHLISTLVMNLKGKISETSENQKSSTDSKEAETPAKLS
jgi:hypothetical protein